MSFFGQFKRRATDDELMDLPGSDVKQLYRTLDQFRGINSLFSRVRPLLRQTLLADMQPGRQYHLVDLGAGACDIPIWLLQQAEKRGLRLRITAVDADPRVVTYARERHGQLQGLKIIEANALDLDALAPFSYLFANHFLHHLPDEVLPKLVSDADRLCERGFIFSDLKRSPWSYLGFSLVAHIYRNSFAREDGLLSIRKGFVADDFRQISGETRTRIKRSFPGRVQMLGGCFSVCRLRPPLIDSQNEPHINH